MYIPQIVSNPFGISTFPDILPLYLPVTKKRITSFHPFCSLHFFMHPGQSILYFPGIILLTH